LELDDVEPIGHYTVRLALQEMFRLICRDVGHRREHVRAMCGRTFDTIAVVYATLASFMVDIKVLEVVVKIDAAGTEIATEEGSMGREHGRDVDVSFSAERDGDAGLPLVKMSDDGGVELLRHILNDRRPIPVSGERTGDDGSRTSPRNHATRYPKMIVSFVSVSWGGEGMPAKFQRSAFHSSSRWNALPVSNKSTRGAPSISQRPYRHLTPAARMPSNVAASTGSVGSCASTSMGAVLYIRGPMRVYRSPYSATVTGTLVFMTV
jgi:hypothetical protein